MRGEVDQGELDRLLGLAKFANTYVKVSAYYALGKKAPPYTDLGPMFRQVRDRVLRATGGNQEPFVYGSLSADALFLNDNAAPVKPQAGDQVEMVLWNSIARFSCVKSAGRPSRLANIHESMRCNVFAKRFSCSIWFELY